MLWKDLRGFHGSLVVNLYYERKKQVATMHFDMNVRGGFLKKVSQKVRVNAVV